jgi:hypothetical protein
LDAISQGCSFNGIVFSTAPLARLIMDIVLFEEFATQATPAPGSATALLPGPAVKLAATVFFAVPMTDTVEFALQQTAT